jgi:hypothetical protein
VSDFSPKKSTIRAKLMFYALTKVEPLEVKLPYLLFITAVSSIRIFPLATKIGVPKLLVNDERMIVTSTLLVLSVAICHCHQ